MRAFSCLQNLERFFAVAGNIRKDDLGAFVLRIALRVRPQNIPSTGVFVLLRILIHSVGGCCGLAPGDMIPMPNAVVPLRLNRFRNHIQGLSRAHGILCERRHHAMWRGDSYLRETCYVFRFHLTIDVGQPRKKARGDVLS